MQYKPSRFNYHFIADDGTYMLYNTLTNALAEFTPDNYQAFLAFSKGEKTLHADFMTGLQSCGFIVPEEYDELLFMRRRMFDERFARTHMLLTIAPTMACNFACDYCFETEAREDKMSDETINQLLQYIEKKRSVEKLLNLHWMGGEPLLALDVIEKLTAGLKTMCATKGMKYISTIITNGYHLTKDVAKHLVNDLEVHDVQITLDGIGATHNRKRPLLGGQPTFDHIVKNIFAVAEILPHLTIRVNLDQENLSEVDLLLDLFDQPALKEKIYLGFSLMSPVDDKTTSRCLHDSTFSLTYQQIRKKKLERGFSERVYPLSKCNPCGVTLNSNQVIDSSGRIFKCWSDFGHPERSIGHIAGQNLSEKQRDNTLLMYDPTEDKQCRECKILPFCLGGCFWKRIHLGKSPCTLTKSYLEDTLKYYVQNKLYLTS